MSGSSEYAGRPSGFAIPAHVRAIPPYVQGREPSSVAREYGLDESRLIIMASNENPLGMSDKAREALLRFSGNPGRYPDSDGVLLKEAIANKLAIDPSWIMLGNGSSDLLEMIARSSLERGRNAIISQYAFSVYRAAIQMTSGECVTIPARDFGHDLEAMLDTINAATAVVYLANPNNPTGTYFSEHAFERFLRAVPEQILVVLDEAYREYLEPGERFKSLDMLQRFPNLVLTRTFSKAFGLAGLRIGFAVARPELVATMNKVRTPYHVNMLGQVTARAAIGDVDFVERSRLLNSSGMDFLTAEFDRAKLHYVPSKGNFVMVEVGDGEGVHRQLLARGIIVRPMRPYGLPGWLRVSIGLREENEAFIRALHAVSSHSVAAGSAAI